MLASALLLGLYARGGAAWPLGFVALVPWLLMLERQRGWAGQLLGGYLMTLGLSAACFAWFGSAIGAFTQIGAPTGLALLLLGAPLFQPQVLAFVLVRHAARRLGPALQAGAGAAAWVGTEWLYPKLLGDTLGHGLYPAAALRQAAALGGAAGLSLLLLLVNEALAAAFRRRSGGLRALAPALLPATLAPLLLAGYGWVALASAPVAVPGHKPLRLGLVQANLVDYEGQRRQRGSYEVVREVLDTHYAMSYDAVERQRVDAVLWSETIYPTTFGQPKSEAGAEFDAEILGIVDAARVPFVFGTYDRDAAGEYNAAAFVQPGSGLLGFYRKTRLFPLTEYLPAWADGPTLRAWLPWAGAWKPGSGARVFPLKLTDGREIPVLPLICLDDVDTALGIAGARLGAQAILTLSNDAWFTAHPQGAALHLAVAAFRSIETRLPQFRVTTNGHSAVIDATGRVVAGARLGERTLVVGALPVQPPARTLMVIWGDWVGLAALAYLALLALRAGVSAWPAGQKAAAAPRLEPGAPVAVVVLSPAARGAAALLRTGARAGLLWLGVAVLVDEGLRANTLAQIRHFGWLFLLPELAAWCLLRAFSAQAVIEHGALVLRSGTRRLELALHDIAAVEPWRLPLPGSGVHLRLRSGAAWRYGLLVHPEAMVEALRAAGAALAPPTPASRLALYAQARLAVWRGRLAQPWAKFLLLPLLLALPAFHLHQHIAYGSGLGEYLSYGLKAYLSAFALWWAAWAIGVVLCAAALRVAIEVGTLAAVLLRPARVVALRHQFEVLALLALYIGLPGWLLARMLGS